MAYLTVLTLVSRYGGQSYERVIVRECQAKEESFSSLLTQSLIIADRACQKIH